MIILQEKTVHFIEQINYLIQMIMEIFIMHIRILKIKQKKTEKDWKLLKQKY